MTDYNRYFERRCFAPWLLVAMVMLLNSAGSVSAQPAGPAAQPTPWTHRNHPTSDTFHFAVVSDKAANPREGVFEAAVAKLQQLRPDFVMCVGDLIHGYGEGMKRLTDENLVREKRREFDDSLAPLTVPFYRVAGNHDINSDLTARIWKELYGPDYYSMVYKGALFLCLNSQDGPNYGAGIGDRQVAWVIDTLAKNDDARWVFLFFHQPLWLEDEKRLERAKDEDGATHLTGFQEIEKLLEGRDFTVFAGHHHRYGKWVKNGNKYFRLATTGGQSTLAGPDSGQFDHIVWVTLTDDGPVVCNLLLEGILDEDAKRNMPGGIGEVETK